jgi:beta-lactamase superfamily II metal-dependent hydrolase
MSDEVFQLHVLPAGIGDALVLDYGTADAVSRVVIDGGVGKTAGPLADFLGPKPKIEMLMITHVDNDHIMGALKMLEQRLNEPTIEDLWFNGYRHLPKSALQSMGPVEGERLTTLIVDRGLPWNANPTFGGHAVMTNGDTSPRVSTLPGGLACTVLSPGRQQLIEISKKWVEAVGEANLNPAAITPEELLRPPGRLERLGGVDVATLAAEKSPMDNKEANGSSIAVLAAWADRTALFTGDAHADVLIDTLNRWLGQEKTLDVDVLKLPHHGSKGNVTNELMKRVKAKCYVFSSSGEGPSKHPNDQAVARVIVNSSGPRTLAFNYRNKRTEFWDATDLKSEHGYTTQYPNAEHGGLTIDLQAL